MIHFFSKRLSLRKHGSYHLKSNLSSTSHLISLQHLKKKTNLRVSGDMPRQNKSRVSKQQCLIVVCIYSTYFWTMKTNRFSYKDFRPSLIKRVHQCQIPNLILQQPGTQIYFFTPIDLQNLIICIFHSYCTQLTKSN